MSKLTERALVSTLTATWRLVRSRRDPPWPGFGEPFNGQAERRLVIHRLIADLDPIACIETGTFFGFTAKHLAQSGFPVYTIERDVGLYNVSRARFLFRPRVHVFNGDSAAVLPALAAEQTIHRPFVYLDAHWGEELPLVAEIDTALVAWADCVIVIDDFLVPHDSGYGYDTYDGQPLSIDMICLPPGVTAAYPALPAAQETGAKRGTLYLGQGRGADCIAAAVDAGHLTLATASPDHTR